MRGGGETPTDELPTQPFLRGLTALGLPGKPVTMENHSIFTNAMHPEAA
jgi:hypothetical protein